MAAKLCLTGQYTPPARPPRGDTLWGRGGPVQLPHMARLPPPPRTYLTPHFLLQTCPHPCPHPSPPAVPRQRCHLPPPRATSPRGRGFGRDPHVPLCPPTPRTPPAPEGTHRRGDTWAHPCTQGPSPDPRKGTHRPVAVSLVLSCRVAPSRPPPPHGTAPLGMESIDGRWAGDAAKGSGPSRAKCHRDGSGGHGDFPWHSRVKGRCWGDLALGGHWGSTACAQRTWSTPNLAEGEGGPEGDEPPARATSCVCSDTRMCRGDPKCRAPRSVGSPLSPWSLPVSPRSVPVPSRVPHPLPPPHPPAHRVSTCSPSPPTLRVPRVPHPLPHPRVSGPRVSRPRPARWGPPPRGGVGGAPGSEPLLWIRGAEPRGRAGGTCEGTGSSSGNSGAGWGHPFNGTFGVFPVVWGFLLLFFQVCFFAPPPPLGFPRATPARPPVPRGRRAWRGRREPGEAGAAETLPGSGSRGHRWGPPMSG